MREDGGGMHEHVAAQPHLDVVRGKLQRRRLRRSMHRHRGLEDVSKYSYLTAELSGRSCGGAPFAQSEIEAK
jgi:hypothetical protein